MVKGAIDRMLTFMLFPVESSGSCCILACTLKECLHALPVVSIDTASGQVRKLPLPFVVRTNAGIFAEQKTKPI